MNCVWRENKSCCEISVSVKPTLWHRFSWVIKRLNRPPPADTRLSALSENSWPQWPRENGNQALRKTEAIFFGTFLPTLGKLADCSKPPSALCFELPIKSCHLTTVPPPTTTILFYIIIFLDHSSPPIPLFCGLSLLPSCSPCWWSGGIIGAAYWWLAACVSGQRDSCIYTSKWQTDYFIKTLSVDRFAGHEGLCELLPVCLSSRAFERS